MLPDKHQRLVLFNQYEILKHLDPQNAQSYFEKQEVVANGYEQAYEWMTDFLSEVPMHVCESVLRALEVCDILDASQTNGGFQSAELYRTFIGYDGNNEVEYLSYARFIVKVQGKFSHLGSQPFNSHMMSVAKYERMYAKWKSMGMGANLSPSDVDTIAKA